MKLFDKVKLKPNYNKSFYNPDFDYSGQEGLVLLVSETKGTATVLFDCNLFDKQIVCKFGDLEITEQAPNGLLSVLISDEQSLIMSYYDRVKIKYSNNVEGTVKFVHSNSGLIPIPFVELDGDMHAEPYYPSQLVKIGDGKDKRDSDNEALEETRKLIRESITSRQGGVVEFTPEVHEESDIVTIQANILRSSKKTETYVEVDGVEYYVTVTRSGDV